MDDIIGIKMIIIGFVFVVLVVAGASRSREVRKGLDILHFFL